jgi:hypothetical protein
MSTTQAPAPALDMDKLNNFIGKFVTDLGAAVHTGMVVIGEKLGLYKALAEGPMSSAELATKTQTDERYLSEWLASQAAGGYITFDETSNKFSLSEEQAFTLAKEDSTSLFAGSIRTGSGITGRCPAHCRLLPQRCRNGLARARGRRVSWMRKVLPAWLCWESGRQLDTRASGYERQT